MKLRKGKIQEVDNFIKVVTLSAPKFMYNLFGNKTEKLLSFLYKRKKNYFSHQFFNVLEVEGEVVGGILSYTKEQYKRTGIKTTLLILLKLNVTLLYNLPTLLKAQSMIGSLRGGEMYISNIAVGPKFRGKGYGREIINQTEKLAISQGCRKLSLDVDADNKKAIKLYKSLGFSLEEDEATTFTIKDTEYKFYKMSKKL